MFKRKKTRLYQLLPTLGSVDPGRIGRSTLFTQPKQFGLGSIDPPMDRSIPPLFHQISTSSILDQTVLPFPKPISGTLTVNPQRERSKTFLIYINIYIIPKRHKSKFPGRRALQFSPTYIDSSSNLSTSSSAMNSNPDVATSNSTHD